MVDLHIVLKSNNMSVLKRGDSVAVIPYNEADVKLLGRLMRAEAEGDGQLGMLMVGNTGVNRVRGGLY